MLPRRHINVQTTTLGQRSWFAGKPPSGGVAHSGATMPATLRDHLGLDRSVGSGAATAAPIWVRRGGGASHQKTMLFLPARIWKH